MKILVIIIALMLPCVVFSQSQDSIFQYCQVRLFGKSTGISIEIDYGQEKKFFDKSSVLKDDKGDFRIFNSVAHALNYMGAMGWRVIQTYKIGPDPDLFDQCFLMETKKKSTR
ncbi:hypothetical protein [Daejeonella sp.]|uniref:hypothetical protein n=1 Tax=Daejeonella sp. TaxID=2805397 RepID=UPI0030BBFB41